MDIQSMMGFFNHPFFIIVGSISILLMLAGFLSSLYLMISGVIPVWYRLGNSLSKRKIAIFADNKYEELRDILVDSNLFKARNIIRADRNSLRKAEDVSFFIVHYAAYKDEMDSIISMKQDSDAMLVYAPQDEGRIDNEVMAKINAQRNSIVVNVRGRLLNDVLVSMITTSFK